ncbi:MAG: pitrilysin family protein [candidate division Zixibacteria bacterium]|nr:pitrilysin family protein [candidate division Zixibacteria bacterium]
MKTNMLKASFGLLALALVAASLSAQDVKKIKFPKLNDMVIPQVERVTLDNGIRLYLLEDKSLPVVNMSVRVNAGSYLEPADKVGLAGICGEVLRTGGTKKWTGDEIDAALEAVGGSVETGIGLLSGNASVNVLTDYTDLGLEVLSEVLQRPVFDEDKIDLAKVNNRSAISRRNDDPQDIGSREFSKLIYGAESVYARQTEYESISAITRDDLVQFHATYYKPENIQIAVWGDINKAGMIDKIKQHFGAWQKGSTPVPPPPTVDYTYESKVYYVSKDDVNQSNIYIGHIGGLVSDPDYAARIVMNNILGGSFGSRLFNTVRSKEGLAYSTFGVYTANIAYPGVFYNYVGTKSETTAKAIKVMLQEIKRIQTDAPTPEEMAMGKDGYLNSFVFNFDSKGEVINRLMTYDFYKLPDDLIFRQKAEVEKVTSADVIATAKKNLRTDAMNILVVGKGKDFEMPLDQLGLGAITTLDVTIPSGEEKKELAVTPENMSKGKELLDKAVKAHGGLDQFKKINSISMKGTVTVTTPQGEIPLGLESVEVFPGKSRQVVSAFGQKMYDVRNGNAGWQSSQTGLMAKTEDDLVKDDKEEARKIINIFRQSDNPSYQAVYDGSGKVDDSPVDYVTILSKSGETICRLGVSRSNNQVIARSYWGETMMGPGQLEETYTRIGEFNGVKIFVGSTITKDGQKYSNIDMSDVVINGQVPANSFEKPE